MLIMLKVSSFEILNTIHINKCRVKYFTDKVLREVTVISSLGIQLMLLTHYYCRHSGSEQWKYKAKENHICPNLLFKKRYLGQFLKKIAFKTAWGKKIISPN